MKTLVQIVLFGLALVPSGLRAAETPLEEQLDALGTPGDKAPAGLTSEKLYAVQNRYSELRRRLEFAVGIGNNFSTSSFLASKNGEASLRYYLTNRWYLGTSASYVGNEFSRDAQLIIENPGVVPDVGVTTYRADLLLGYNLFYGKFRASMDQVFYFDQYVALGPGVVWMQSARSLAGVADIGFAFWFGRNFSLRAGFKNYIFHETRFKSASVVNNSVGYLQAGYVFGG